jgi:hypothetical protein
MTNATSDAGIYRVKVSNLHELQTDLNDIMRNPASAVIDVVPSGASIGIVYIDASDMPNPFDPSFNDPDDDRGLPN